MSKHTLDDIRFDLQYKCTKKLMNIINYKNSGRNEKRCYKVGVHSDILSRIQSSSNNHIKLQSL